MICLLVTHLVPSVQKLLVRLSKMKIHLVSTSSQGYMEKESELDTSNAEKVSKLATCEKRSPVLLTCPIVYTCVHI